MSVGPFQAKSVVNAIGNPFGSESAWASKRLWKDDGLYCSEEIAGCGFRVASAILFVKLLS